MNYTKRQMKAKTLNSVERISKIKSEIAATKCNCSVAAAILQKGAATHGVVLQIKRVVNPQIVLASRRADEDFAPHYQRTVLPITGTKIPPCKLTAQRYFVLSDQNGSSSSPVW